jgi:signal transduction histidine kinase
VIILRPVRDKKVDDLMATRARELLDRSRVLLDRSREAAAQILGTPRPLSPVRRAIEPAPAWPVPMAQPARTGPDEALVGICASVALRDLNLVDSLLSQLEEMEAKEDDQDRLGELYRLDHLATRLRRNAENLRVLAGRDASDSGSDSASLVDVIRAAMSSIDHYARITIGRVVSLGVVGYAAEDLSRLLAELLDNAANQSPPSSPVRVSAHLTEQGSVLLRIEDEGIGMPPERLRELNSRLEAAPVLDDDSVRHMGLAVVRRLAGRHDMRAHLDRRAPHGTTATVLLPSSLVCELPEVNWSGSQTVVFPQATFGELDLALEGAAPIVPADDRPAGGRHSTGATLPRRKNTPSSTTGGDRPAQDAAPQARRKPTPSSTVGGTTAGGLPRRVSRSIKGAVETPSPVPRSTAPADEKASHNRLLADLDAFSDGERAARNEQSTKTTDEPETSPGGTQQ